METKKETKKHRKQLLNHIKQESKPNNTELPDPVELIREDREK